MAASVTDTITGLLTASFTPSHLEVIDESDGCGAKINVIIVSAGFSGKPTLRRHKAVHAALKDILPDIHAFSQKTHTPEEWAKKNAAS